jgi:hypothetical protein
VFELLSVSLNSDTIDQAIIETAAPTKNNKPLLIANPKKAANGAAKHPIIMAEAFDHIAILSNISLLSSSADS